MGTNKLAGTELRNTLKRVRTGRGWSMVEMADMLRAKGLTAYPTTIAKIEAGDRAVQIDELVAFAELFEVSVDTLLGHSTGHSQDKAFQVWALVDAERQSLWQLSTTERTLRQAVTNVDSFKLNANERTLRDGCEAACDAMADAMTALVNTEKAASKIGETK